MNSSGYRYFALLNLTGHNLTPCQPAQDADSSRDAEFAMNINRLLADPTDEPVWLPSLGTGQASGAGRFVVCCHKVTGLLIISLTARNHNCQLQNSRGSNNSWSEFCSLTVHLAQVSRLVIRSAYLICWKPSHLIISFTRRFIVRHSYSCQPEPALQISS